MKGSYGASSDGSETKVKDVRDDRFRTDSYSTRAPDRAEEARDSSKSSTREADLKAEKERIKNELRDLANN